MDATRDGGGAATTPPSLPPPPWSSVGQAAGQRVTGPDGGTMVWVPPGEFLMGCTEAEVAYAGRVVLGEWSPEAEQPARQVHVSAGFWLGACQVTFAQYRAFCRQPRHGYPGVGDPQEDPHPVVHVTWNSAAAYCEHFGLSLPTEEQWEYAARGPQSNRYPWGDRWDTARCCNRFRRGPSGQTSPVGSFPQGASWCGALDMAGNVAEWCQAGASYPERPLAEPAAPRTDHPEQVVRGGGWDGDAFRCRASYRYVCSALHRANDVGFRCAFTP